MLTVFLLRVWPEAGRQAKKPTREARIRSSETVQANGHAFACTSTSFGALLNQHFLTYL
jgi:hypothetical protein